jgi:ferredoxin--NADP+ reductase
MSLEARDSIMQPPHSKHVPDDIPSNIYKLKSPLTAKIKGSTRLTGEDSPNEVRHIQIDTSGSDFWYLDGQSLGVLPPGINPNTEKPFKLRLYSISSPSKGDDGEGNTVSLCVKRLIYEDEAGEEVQGVCSNYLCDLPVGSDLHVTGPVGKAFLMPPYEHANMIMVATGTGIAPFRAFIKTRYDERKDEHGQTHLFFGAQYSSDALYKEELAELADEPTFHLHTAYSREEKNAEGQRMYVQHKIYEHRTEMLKLLQDDKTFFYICGLRGMETGILEALKTAASEANVDWNALYHTLKDEHRWHVEVY